jgi:hypothetical protein
MLPRGDEALAERFEAALDRIGAYFMGSSPLQDAAAQIARALGDMKIDYAIAGALCLAAHGVVRATEDVDVLIAREGLERFKQAWLGRGYVDVRPGGKAVRDTANGVKIDFLIEDRGEHGSEALRGNSWCMERRCPLIIAPFVIAPEIIAYIKLPRGTLWG